MKKRMHTLFFLLLTAFAALVTGCGDGGSESDDSQIDTSVDFNKSYDSVLLFYATGSTLEEGDSRFASSDLSEIIQGYGRLASSERAKLKILIAFGGSRKPTWQGVKFATIDCLSRDAADGTFGNDACYDVSASDADMGDPATLESFLAYAGSALDQSTRKYLVFWNHGGAYKGVCFDSAHNGDQLTVSELHDALDRSGRRFDMIGMDACLMGNFEVTKALAPYARYYLASEAVEPAHGWNYVDVIREIGRHGKSVMPNLGKAFVDSYMDSPQHQQTQDKTLAFLDLSQVANVSDKIDALAATLNVNTDFATIGLSADDSQKFSISSRHSDGIAIDLKQFARMVALHDSAKKAPAQALDEAVGRLIVYGRTQKFDANGVSVFQPLDDGDWNLYRDFTYVASARWKSLLADFTVIKGNDHVDPVIHSQAACEVGGASGFCLNITDDVALKDVMSYGLMPYGSDSFVLLYSEFLDHDRSTYFLPRFDAHWIYLCNGEKGKCIFPSAFEIESPDPDIRLYGSFGKYNGIDVIYLISIEKQTISLWAVPDTGDAESPKIQYRVKQGDRVTFDYIGIDKNFESFLVEGDSLTFTNEPSWQWLDFDFDVTYYALAEDFNDNDAVSDIHQQSAQGGSATPGAIDTASSQSRLQFLAGKTLELNYDFYGTLYNDSITFAQAPQYNESIGNYVIEGSLNAEYDIFCFSDDDPAKRVTIGSTAFMYDCTTLYDGANSIYVFNIDAASSRVSGYYSYAAAGVNPYAAIQTPDATLIDSTLSR